MSRLLRSAQLGAATGLRSMAAPSQLSRFLAKSPADAAGGSVAGFLANGAVRALLQVAYLGEMIGDKLPTVPDRIESSPLLGRAVFGSITGGVLAGTQGESRALGAVFGGAGAVLGAYAGYHARRALVREGGLPDLPVALCEDVVALLLARTALR